MPCAPMVRAPHGSRAVPTGSIANSPISHGRCTYEHAPHVRNVETQKRRHGHGHQQGHQHEHRRTNGTSTNHARTCKARLGVRTTTATHTQAEYETAQQRTAMDDHTAAGMDNRHKHKESTCMHITTRTRAQTLHFLRTPKRRPLRGRPQHEAGPQPRASSLVS